MEEKKFTHFNAAGRPRMVDVSEKEPTVREAVARGEVVMSSATLAAVKEGRVKKGDVLAVAQVAGIMAAKRTATIIPMCHPIGLTGVDLHFALQEPDRILIQATVRTCDRTGVEMEALTAVAAAALTIYDMCKSIDKGIVINNIRLVKKTGGKSGDYYRPGEEEENEG